MVLTYTEDATLASMPSPYWVLRLTGGHYDWATYLCLWIAAASFHAPIEAGGGRKWLFTPLQLCVWGLGEADPLPSSEPGTLHMHTSLEHPSLGPHS